MNEVLFSTYLHLHLLHFIYITKLDIRSNHNVINENKKIIKRFQHSSHYVIFLKKYLKNEP